MYMQIVHIDGSGAKPSSILTSYCSPRLHKAIANAQAEGFRELSWMETLCPFQLFYSGGMEQLGTESAREHVCWVGTIWEVLDHLVIIPDCSETQLPMGSMHTIQLMHFHCLKNFCVRGICLLKHKRCKCLG
ncbi:hypothetical protein EI94DRAFT_1703425 [Lactarius quietus]|nr:hypothetical protein EI94DRAFT_1703425 [Lactarius quietus]